MQWILTPAGRALAATCTALIVACKGSDATGASNANVLITEISCVTISDNQFERGYSVVAFGTAQGPVDAILTPSVGQGTGPSDPNRSGEAVSFFSTDWSLPGAANISDRRADDDPETTDIEIDFETIQPKPLKAMSVYAELDLFLPNNAGRKNASKSTVCQ
jgi:hypothetical protein